MCVCLQRNYLFIQRFSMVWNWLAANFDFFLSCYFSKSIFDRIKDHHGLVKIMNFIPKLDRQKLMIVSNKVKIALRFSS